MDASPPSVVPEGPAPHAHTHAHLPSHALSPRAKRLVVALLVTVAAITIIGMVALWPNDVGRHTSDDGARQVGGTVVKIVIGGCDPAQSAGQGSNPDSHSSPCGTATVRLTSGPDAGKEITAPTSTGPGAERIRPGDSITLLYTPGSLDGFQYQIVDHQRGLQLWMLVVAFALAIVVFGRWRGLASLAGLVLTFAVLLLFIVPSIIDGHSPLLVAIVGSAAIMLSVLYLTHGPTMSTSMAVLGTLASLTLTGLTAALSTAALHLGGLASEDAFYLTIAYQDVDMQGLLLAGIVIGSLGVLDDVAVTQAVTVAEIAAANPRLSARQLYRAAARVGRAHITSVVNTIILAYAGASLPLLILISNSGRPLAELLTTQALSQEIVRSVVGTMGLVAAVPITTGLAALAASHTRTRTVDAPEPATARIATLSAKPAAGWLDDDDQEDWYRTPMR